MALVDVDSWHTEYNSCARLNDTVLSQLNQRDGKITDSPDYNRLTLSIQVGLKQFDRELQQLKFKLSEARSSNTVGSDEVFKRQQQLDGLTAQRQHLQAKYNNAISDSRAALLGSTSSTLRGNTSVAEDSDAAPIIETDGMQTFRRNRDMMIEEQNRGLETLAQTLSRQRAIATQFGQEVEDQNEILDNLANTLERVEAGVGRETRNIGLVNQRDSTWGYWLVIILLFVLIILVVLI